MDEGGLKDVWTDY